LGLPALTQHMPGPKRGTRPEGLMGPSPHRPLAGQTRRVVEGGENKVVTTGTLSQHGHKNTTYDNRSVTQYLHATIRPKGDAYSTSAWFQSTSPWARPSRRPHPCMLVVGIVLTWCVHAMHASDPRPLGDRRQLSLLLLHAGMQRVFTRVAIVFNTQVRWQSPK